VDVLGVERHVVVAREVTKLHEEFLRGTAEQVLLELKSRPEVKGEITLLIAKPEPNHHPAVKPKNLRVRLQEIMTAETVDEKTAMKKLAKEVGVSKSEVYRELQRVK
jgi:16S rRNA (cytidine1402-2'-O)-methyltransferase